MSSKRIFARAKPADIRCREAYRYTADISSNPNLSQKRAPEGTIDIRIPYDGYEYVGRKALHDIQQQLGGTAMVDRQKALVGHLGFHDYHRTDLDSVLELTIHNDVVPVTIPLSGQGFTGLGQLHSDRHECHLGYRYNPKPLEVHPIHVEAFLLDEESLQEAESLQEMQPHGKSSQEALVQKLAKQAVFSRTLMLRFEVELHLPDVVLSQEISPRLAHVSVDWPRTASHNAVTLLLGTSSAKERLVYNPEAGTLEWGDVSFRHTGKASGTGLRSYVSAPMVLSVSQPGDLYRQEAIRGSLQVELPDVLLSGTAFSYFNSRGSRAAENPINRSTTIDADMTIWLEDRFGVRTLSPYRHLQFDGVILDSMRVQDIVTLLEDRGFEVANPVELSARREGGYGALIVGKKLEGAEQMYLWLMAEGVRTTTTRETKIRGGKTFTTEVDTGNMKVYMRGQLKGDSHRLTTVMNDIQMSLKERLRHVSTLE